MTDKEAITSSYEAILKNQFLTLFKSFIIATTKTEKSQALKRFKKGLAIAKEAKTEALSQLI
jgi:hypothetical protein